MDQQQSSDVVSDATVKASDLCVNAEKTLQDKIDQSKPMLQNLQETAGAAIDKATDLARKASAPINQAADAIHGIA